MVPFRHVVGTYLFIVEIPLTDNIHGDHGFVGFLIVLHGLT